MFNNSSDGPLIVELMDISKQNEAILKFFILGVGSKVFNIGSTPSEVEAYIIDYDFPGAKAHWDENHADERKPRIILSTSDPLADNSVWVGKPLSSKKLIEAAATVKELLKNPPTAPAISRSNEADAIDVSHHQERTPQLAEQRPFSLASETPAVVPKKQVIPESLGATTLVSNKSTEHTRGSEPQRQPVPLSSTEQNVRANIEKERLEVEQPTQQEKINKPKTKEQIALEAKQLEMRWNELCGDSNDTETYQGDDLRYVPDNYFIGKLIGAVRLAKQSQQIVEIKAPSYFVYVLPNDHQIFTVFDIKSDQFIAFSRERIKQGEVNIHILSSIETGKLELQMSKQPEYIHSLESFLWTSSLLVSKGRLPSTVDVDKKTALRYWPSFARIEAFPYSMRIAALWHHSPDSLVQMAKKLEIPQRYVFAFYNGADALGLVEHDPKKVKKQIKAKPKKKGGSLITRLFKRLLKGGAG